MKQFKMHHTRAGGCFTLSDKSDGFEICKSYTDTLEDKNNFDLFAAAPETAAELKEAKEIIENQAQTIQARNALLEQARNDRDNEQNHRVGAESKLHKVQALNAEMADVAQSMLDIISRVLGELDDYELVGKAVDIIKKSKEE